MKKLILYMVIFTVSVVFQIAFMRDSAVDGVAIIEKRAVLMASLCTLFSVVLVYSYIREENRKARREIAQIEKQIARNEAEQRAILREMDAHTSPVRHDIMKKLPKE